MAVTDSTIGGPIRWRVHLRSPPAKVYAMLSTDEGRSRFWAESAEERGGAVEFRFPNGERWRARILQREPPTRFALEYFAGSRTTFELEDDGRGGTDLTLTDAEVPKEEWTDRKAGWISVLMALKAAIDHGVDLRNHDPARTWDQRFVES
jgi:uncharacterized protein YndB with AHSA1/START domain